MLGNYTFLRKSLKWWRKLFIHMLNMVVLNSYILNKKFGKEKLSHEEFRQKIVTFLIEEGLETCAIKVEIVHGMGNDNEARLRERHFPENIPAALGAKRKKPSRVCFVCNKLNKLGKGEKRWTSYWCPDCSKPLCPHNCFRKFHTQKKIE